MTPSWIAAAVGFGLAFVAGSLPFSYWIGRLALKTDIRTRGDGNPGATNVLRAGGRGWGALALALDCLKGALPVAVANFVLHWDGLALALVAIAPILGHAFSPFLAFRGGKAVAATFGIWTGLTIWEAPSVLGIMLGLWYAFIDVDGWAVLLAMLSLLMYFVLTGHTGDTLLIAWVGNTAVLAWKHRQDLTRMPEPRRWLQKRGTS
ncbi:MAG: glycerol-3-phosphate acyltransferase [Burkholderiales bacterium]|nr:glycerol-3-phosphate acyltransferase [Anaerolineae bacterium]